MARVEIDRVTKRFGQIEVFNDLEIDIPHGEFVALLGSSGCDKSTLLRCLAGFEDLTGEDIRFAGESVVDTAPAKRDAATVFQSYALYPHKTAAENMGFALKIANVSAEEIEQKVAEAAEILGIEPLLDKRPRQLSGGQRQRVAIGRAIVREPDVFLFDEPLSNLVAELRARMRLELTRLHGKLDATMIYVTHDQIEAMTRADRIVILQAGQIRQIGTPQEVFDAPNDLFVAQFIGAPAMNLFEAEKYPEAMEVLSQKFGDLTSGAKTIGVRPEGIRFGAGDGIDLPMTIDVCESLGKEQLYHGSTDIGDEVTISTRDKLTTQSGAQTVTIQPETVHAHRGAEGRTMYATSKAALEGMMRTLAAELASSGVRAVSLALWPFDSPALRAAASRFYTDGSPDYAVAEFTKAQSLGQIGQASQVGDLISFLVSSAGNFVSGTTLMIDGVQTSRLPVPKVQK